MFLQECVMMAWILLDFRALLETNKILVKSKLLHAVCHLHPVPPYTLNGHAQSSSMHPKNVWAIRTKIKMQPMNYCMQVKVLRPSMKSYLQFAGNGHTKIVPGCLCASLLTKQFFFSPMRLVFY